MLFQNVELHNVAELIPAEDGQGWQMLRLPTSVSETLNKNAQYHSLCPAGCEIRFNLKDGQKAKVTLAAAATKVPAVVEVYQGCFRTQVEVVRNTPTEITIEPVGRNNLEKVRTDRNLPFDSRLFRVMLPTICQTQLIGIDGDVTPPQAGQTPKTRYLAYGSSITHGAFTVRPGGTYPAMTAKNLQVDLLNQGYAGGAHMEETIAQYLAGRIDWDFATLELGINVGGWQAEQFAAAVEKFIHIIGSAHRDKWIFCIDLFTFKGDLDVGHPHHQGFRDVVLKAAEAARFPKLVHIDGRDILKDVTGLAHDLVHPTDEGFFEMSSNLSAIMRQTMGTIR
jgi:hypothetical protein